MNIKTYRYANYVSLVVAALFFTPMSAMDADGLTPLWQKVKNKNTKEVESILKKDGNPNELQKRIAREPEHMLGWMIEHPQYLCEKFDCVCKTQAYYNCQSKVHDFTIAKLLLQHGANVSFADPMFDVPLIHILEKVKSSALFRKSEAASFIKSLVCDYKADPNVCSKTGSCPLMYVSYFVEPKDQVMVAEAFLDNGAALETKDFNKKTALLHVADGVTDSTELVEFLLSRGANLQARDLYNNSVARLVAVSLTHKKPKLYNYLVNKDSNLAPKDAIALRCLKFLRK